MVRLKTTLIVLGVALIAMFCVGMPEMVKLVTPARDFYELTPDDLEKDVHVTADIDFTMGAFVTNTKTTTKNGVKVSETETSREYAVPFFGVDADNYIYIDGVMGVDVPTKDFDAAERLADASWAWWEDATGTIPYPTNYIHVDGIARSMDDDEIRLFEQALVDCGYTKEEAKYLVVPYIIEMKNTKSVIIKEIACLIGGVLLVFAGVALFIAGARKRKVQTA